MKNTSQSFHLAAYPRRETLVTRFLFVKKLKSFAVGLFAASCALSSSLAVDYFNYGNNGTFLNVASEYSNTDGSTANATVVPNSDTTDLFFLNSTVVGSSGALTFYTGNSSLRFNSMTFRSNVGSIQFDRNTMAAPTTTVSIFMRGGGITMEAGAGPVTWGSADQRVALSAEADFTITNNSSSDLTFNRDVQSVTNDTTHTITVAGSGSGNTIFHDIRTNTLGRETAMTINTSGSGVVRFAGNNTYLGATTISAGTLQIGTGGTNGTLATGSAITNNGTLIFNRSNAVTQGTDFDSMIAGTGNLVQAGTGVLTLVGNNTYTGMTTVSAGNLSLNNTANNNQTIVGDITINGGRLALATSRANQIADTSSITMSSGTVDFGAVNETINSIAMSGGTLRRGGATLALNAASSFTGGTANFTAQASRINTSGTTTFGNTAFEYWGTGTATQGVILGGNILVNDNTVANFTNNGSGNLGVMSLNSANRTIDVGTGATLNMGWNVSGTSVGITKNGTGSLVLNASNTYSGATIVNAGTLIVNGSLAAGSALTVASGATLGGTGTINGAATVNGNLRPGNSPGVLSFGSSLTLGSTAEITMELNGTTRGTEYDGINVTGALAYGGDLTIEVGSAFLGSSENFSLFTFSSQSGNLESVSLAGAYGSGSFNNSGGIWSLTDSGGNQWSFSQADGNLGFTAVPEPSTWALLGLFGLACAGWKIRAAKRRHAAHQAGNPA
jgi:autotransporter-associated beta strand protein